MSKKGKKRKSSKGTSTGTTLGALALIISIGALGLGVYQFITPTSSEGPPASESPQFYILEHDDIIHLDPYSTVNYLNDLNITYTTEVDDIVVLEFSCRFFLDPVGTTTLIVNFSNNGTLVPSTNIYERSDSDVLRSGYMKYIFEASTAGENHLVIFTTCDVETSNYVIDCVLTVTVYG